MNQQHSSKIVIIPKFIVADILTKLFQSLSANSNLKFNLFRVIALVSKEWRYDILERVFSCFYFIGNTPQKILRELQSLPIKKGIDISFALNNQTSELYQSTEFQEFKQFISNIRVSDNDKYIEMVSFSNSIKYINFVIQQTKTGEMLELKNLISKLTSTTTTTTTKNGPITFYLHLESDFEGDEESFDFHRVSNALSGSSRIDNFRFQNYSTDIIVINIQSLQILSNLISLQIISTQIDTSKSICQLIEFHQSISDIFLGGVTFKIGTYDEILETLSRNHRVVEFDVEPNEELPLYLLSIVNLLNSNKRLKFLSLTNFDIIKPPKGSATLSIANNTIKYLNISECNIQDSRSLNIYSYWNSPSSLVDLYLQKFTKKIDLHEYFQQHKKFKKIYYNGREQEGNPFRSIVALLEGGKFPSFQELYWYNDFGNIECVLQLLPLFSMLIKIHINQTLSMDGLCKFLNQRNSSIKELKINSVDKWNTQLFSTSLANNNFLQTFAIDSVDNSYYTFTEYIELLIHIISHNNNLNHLSIPSPKVSPISNELQSKFSVAIKEKATQVFSLSLMVSNPFLKSVLSENQILTK
ncbi:Hly-III related family protein [Tieghemostelium lacteum]|uniref:Hly-III related family protein n=1 Tax=Tieghemostelium lacteum TaxID=361077 RepID=A0A151ZS98_TIELA|nr:Hly-III related family protein [Tieghemostelium lacteum]|eukprot:KYQ96644.1 Hly-III related family protein [Tieghemostelium lacteum]